MADLPNVVDEDGKNVLVRRLNKEGLLVNTDVLEWFPRRPPPRKRQTSQAHHRQQAVHAHQVLPTPASSPEDESPPLAETCVRRNWGTPSHRPQSCATRARPTTSAVGDDGSNPNQGSNRIAPKVVAGLTSTADALPPHRLNRVPLPCIGTGTLSDVRILTRREPRRETCVDASSYRGKVKKIPRPQGRRPT